MTGRKPFKPLPSKAEALVYPQITLSLLPETGPGNNRKNLAKTVLGQCLAQGAHTLNSSARSPAFVLSL